LDQILGTQLVAYWRLLSSLYQNEFCSTN
jgi:hypothetical protein